MKPKTAKRDKAAAEFFHLRLYIAGQTTKSVLALRNLRNICEERLRNRYKLTVIDLRKQPKLAKGDQILAVPTLIRKLPLPLKRIIGTMSDTERVLVGLDLHPHADKE